MMVARYHRSYDWSARVRTTAVEALRYSHFVTVMKRVLSLGAFADHRRGAGLLLHAAPAAPAAMSYEKLGASRTIWP